MPTRIYRKGPDLPPDAGSAEQFFPGPVLRSDGITLTGYIFFADRFKDTSRDDESLYDAVQALLIRYNHLAGFISLMCLVCTVMAEGIVLYGTNTLLPAGVHRFWINETLLMCFCTFDLILYFVISVLDPHKVERISNQKKSRISEDTTTGNIEEFMAVWGELEDAYCYGASADCNGYCGHHSLILLCKNGLPKREVHFHYTNAILC